VEGALVLLLTAAGVTTIALVAAMFSGRARLKRALRKTRRTAIAQFPRKGPAKIVGRVEYEEPPMTAPFSRRPCAAYEAVLEIQRPDASWDEIVHESDGVTFRVIDETGCAVVVPDDGNCALRQDSQAETHSGRLPSEHQLEFLARHGIGRESRYTNAFRYREGVAGEGAQVAVFGYGAMESDPKGQPVGDAYRGAPMRLVLRSTRKCPILISDEVETLKDPGR
jgi:hypothetical protein